MARTDRWVLWFAACAQLASCALETDTNDLEVDAVESAVQRQSGGTGDTKSKSDLENDGYTCRALEGTTLTLCWKNGSPGYSCDPEGRCIQDARTAPDSPVGKLPDVAVQAELVRAKTPFCLPGEKRVCKLGPPPICTCEPVTPPVVSASFEAR